MVCFKCKCILMPVLVSIHPLDHKKYESFPAAFMKQTGAAKINK